MKRALFIIVLMVIWLAGCKKDDPAEPSSQIGSETSANCTDSASFVNDVTVPDHTRFEPGETFKKTWRIKNTGTCIWNDDYRLVFALNTQMDAPDSVPLKATPPGKEINLSVEMTAPEATGSYRADFQIFDPDGEALPIDNGQYLWTIITVKKP